MNDTYWKTTRPGETAGRVIEPDTGQPLRLDPDAAMVLHARWIDSDAFLVPPETPHPSAGKRVRVTCSFVGPDLHEPENMVAHLWAEAEGIGVCESPHGFGLYLLEDGWPDFWPRENYRRRP